MKALKKEIDPIHQAQPYSGQGGVFGDLFSDILEGIALSAGDPSARSGWSVAGNALRHARGNRKKREEKRENLLKESKADEKYLNELLRKSYVEDRKYDLDRRRLDAEMGDKRLSRDATHGYRSAVLDNARESLDIRRQELELKKKELELAAASGGLSKAEEKEYVKVTSDLAKSAAKMGDFRRRNQLAQEYYNEIKDKSRISPGGVTSHILDWVGHISPELTSSIYNAVDTPEASTARQKLKKEQSHIYQAAMSAKSGPTNILHERQIMSGNVGENLKPGAFSAIVKENQRTAARTRLGASFLSRIRRVDPKIDVTAARTMLESFMDNMEQSGVDIIDSRGFTNPKYEREMEEYFDLPSVAKRPITERARGVDERKLERARQLKALGY